MLPLLLWNTGDAAAAAAPAESAVALVAGWARAVVGVAEQWGAWGCAVALVALAVALVIRLQEHWALRHAREVIRRICRGDYEEAQALVERPGVWHLRDELGTMARHLQETTVSREYLLDVVEGIPGAVLGTDADGRVVLWNEHARRITGYSSDDVLGRRCHELGLFRCGAEERPCPRESGDPLLQVEMPLRRRDGSEIVVAKSADLLPQVDGSAPGTIEVFIDVSEKKRYEEQLLEQRAELEASRTTALQTLEDLKRTLHEREEAREAAESASRLKSQFLANVSHEIRTPLNSIIGFAQLLRESPLFPEDAEYVDAIARSGAHLKELIEEVLDLSKIEAGKLLVNPHGFDPRALVQSVVHMLRPRAQAKGLEFEVEVAPGLPAELQGDSTRIRQVFINLVGNAIKFTDAGTVRLEVDWGGEELLLAVADTGPGIPEEQRARIFEPFFQADGSTTRRHGGTGLGLAIVRGLVLAMGGQLAVETQLGRGTTFSVRFPLHCVEGELGTEAAPVSERQPRGRGRVLLVEDDQPSALLARVILERAGYRAIWAAGGGEGLDLFALGTWDAVLLDMQMPDVDGYEVARRIRGSAQGKQVPIIALTAHAAQGDRERCLAAGCSEYLSKPLDASALLQLLAAVTGSAEAASTEQTSAGVAEDAEIARLRREYLQHVTAEVRNRLAALDEQDIAAVAASAHAWKGSGGTYGYPGISERAEDLEQLAIAGDVAGARRCLQGLEDHLRFLDELAGSQGETRGQTGQGADPLLH